MVPTPTQSRMPLRPADFSGLAEALDYAALGEAGASGDVVDARGVIALVGAYLHSGLDDLRPPDIGWLVFAHSSWILVG